MKRMCEAGVLISCAVSSVMLYAAADTLRLNIEPLPAESKATFEDLQCRPYITAYADWYTWCPSVHKGAHGKYHMFHTRWPKSIGFLSWLTHSEIVHAIADHPEGPFSEVAVAIPPTGEGRGGWFTAHNSKIKKFGDTYFMIIKGDKPGGRGARNQALATSPRPEGPWTIQHRPVIDNLDTEDASMWYDQTRKRFYAVFHAHTFIGMMTSRDGFHWEKAAQYRLSPKEIPFDDGTIWAPQRMERPFVLTDEMGCPQLLFVACKKGNMAVNIALPLSAAKD